MALNSNLNRKTYVHIAKAPSVQTLSTGQPPSAPENQIPTRYRWYPDLAYAWHSSFSLVPFYIPSHFPVTACDAGSRNLQNNSNCFVETFLWHFHILRIQMKTTRERQRTNRHPSAIATRH